MRVHIQRFTCDRCGVTFDSTLPGEHKKWRHLRVEPYGRSDQDPTCLDFCPSCGDALECFVSTVSDNEEFERQVNLASRRAYRASIANAIERNMDAFVEEFDGGIEAMVNRVAEFVRGMKP